MIIRLLGEFTVLRDTLLFIEPQKMSGLKKEHKAK